MSAILICGNTLCLQCASNSVIGAPLHLILMDLRFICIRNIVHKSSAGNSISFHFCSRLCRIAVPCPCFVSLVFSPFSYFILAYLSSFIYSFLLFISFYFFFVSLVLRPKVQNWYVSLFRHFSLRILMYFSNTLYNKFNDLPLQANREIKYSRVTEVESRLKNQSFTTSSGRVH